jgi:diguanylate cyclase (GGDEF)-like protein
MNSPQALSTFDGVTTGVRPIGYVERAAYLRAVAPRQFDAAVPAAAPRGAAAPRSTRSQRKVERLLFILKTQTEIATLGLDVDSVMELVAERAQALTHAAGAVVELADGDSMVSRASSGGGRALLGLRFKRSGSLSGLCVDQGRALRCHHSETDHVADRESCGCAGLRSMIVAPFRHNAGVAGVLKVLSPRPRAFDRADLHILQLMADLIAAALYRAAKYEASELFHRATHDSLTGLANRAFFLDRLQHRLAQAQRNSESLAILNLDIDRLKQVNDSHGHRAGDAAIREIAARIQNTSRDSDTVARIGGDEFVVLLSRVDDRAGALLQAQRLAESIGLPFQFEQHALTLSASIGLALYPQDGPDLDSLLEKADQSMYRMKRSRAPAAEQAAA